MTAEKTAIGIDYFDDIYHVARVIHGGGRPSIQALVQYEQSQMKNHPLLEGGEIVMSVPDDKIIVKDIHLETVGGVDLNDQARFEMTKSLLDDDTDFYLDVIDTGIENRYIALAIHRQTLNDDIIDPFSQTTNLLQKPRGLTRGIALGEGYIAFCRPHGGELICLANYVNDLLSICFVLRQHIVGLSYLNIGRLDLSTRQGQKAFAMELKTMINFKLANFFENGITLPLTALLVSGNKIDDTIMSELGRYFPVSVNRPQFNTGFFSEPEEASSIPLENYLVALGLANN
ncbi:MAG: hypothetical protein DRP47_09220 [Candidatus Zixiibacteriota bacterium]|nr:MAG: hypothetical protein DRP47_09220 [candidate division Zixibacteria bacterium]